MPPSVVFWDFDGTLARRDELWAGALRDALQSIDSSWELHTDRIRPHLRRGFPWHEPERSRPASSAEEWWIALSPVLTKALTANGVYLDVARAAVERVPTEYYRPASWHVVDGAVEALGATKSAGWRNVILSNHAPELPELVRALDLDALIESVITSATIGAEKPNPIIFMHALTASNARAVDCWMVGDNSTADIAGAEAVGMRAILVGDADGSGASSLREAADRIIGSAADRAV